MSSEVITIYHNPNCSKSCAVLELLAQANVAVNIIYYLDTPPDRAILKRLALESGLPLLDLVRTDEALFTELNLQEASEETLLAAIEKHPILLNRPIAQSEKGTQLCRPPEKVFEIL